MEAGLRSGDTGGPWGILTPGEGFSTAAGFRVHRDLVFLLPKKGAGWLQQPFLRIDPALK